MPMQQALSAVIENSINQAIALSLNGEELIAGLANKRCIIYLHEPQTTLAFHFSEERVHVLSLEKPDEAYLQDMPDDECFISVSLFALPELKQTSQLTKLIKQDKLDFYGDLGIAQKFSKVFANIEFDLEETLSQYIGDAPAYTVMSQSKKWQTSAKKQFDLFAQMLSDAALEEKPIAVRPIMVANFVDEVRSLKMDTDRLEARIQRLHENSAKEAK